MSYFGTLDILFLIRTPIDQWNNLLSKFSGRDTLILGRCDLSYDINLNDNQEECNILKYIFPSIKL